MLNSYDLRKQYRIERIYLGLIRPVCHRKRLKWLMAGLLALVSCIALSSCAMASATELIEGHTVKEWTNAIYQAEGGKKTKFPYGIKSVSCKDSKACELVCTRTVRNNYKRWTSYGYKRYPKFIQFLGSRFCPTSGLNRNQNEIYLNRFWINNVNYYLGVK